MSFTQDWTLALSQDRAGSSEYQGECVLEQLYEILYPNGTNEEED